MTLFSILKHPVFQCSSSSLVGGALKSYYNGKSTCDILTGMNVMSESQPRTKFCYHKDNTKGSVFLRLSIDHEFCPLFVVFRKELYCIKKHENGGNVLCKYSYNRKEFKPQICGAFNLKHMDAYCALKNDDNEKDLTIMYLSDDQGEEPDVQSNRFALITFCIPSTRVMNTEKQYIRTTFDVHKYYIRTTFDVH